MSITGKTENLELSQWELTDPFLMEDMNEDFRKIDKAVEARALVKLLDMTIQESMSSVVLNLSEIDFTDIVEVQVYYPSGGSTNMRINSFYGNLKYYNFNGNWQDASTPAYSPDGRISIKNSYGLASTKGNVYLTGFNHYYAAASSLGALRTLTLTNSSGFSEGDRFVVLGVRA